MVISELIDRLIAHKDKLGDVAVAVRDSNCEFWPVDETCERVELTVGPVVFLDSNQSNRPIQ